MAATRGRKFHESSGPLPNFWIHYCLLRDNAEMYTVSYNMEKCIQTLLCTELTINLLEFTLDKQYHGDIELLIMDNKICTGKVTINSRWTNFALSSINENLLL